MARPHIMFVQAQMIPWSRGLHGDARPDVECKTLSRDDTDDSASCIVRYPAGWQRSTVEQLACHEEFLVLDGAIEINGRLYEKHTYAFLPAGYRRERARVRHGCVLLDLFYATPSLRTAGMSQHTPNPAEFDERLLVEYVNPLLMDWDPGLVDPQLSKGVAIKPLRTDPYTGETSFLYCSPPHRVPPGMAKPQWTHPMVEELYTLEGDYVWGDLGRMQRGGYCWWRENVYHGPAGTDTGYNLFVRTVNGPLINTFDTVKKPFSWDPPHRPMLPPELAPYGQPLPPQPNY
ncbi:MAG: DUF4437 domain-containing protein [Sinobacteraceae bacterium]|nr:DUF4437 domain-containing protein [Nevskiaceae bacterium]